MTDAIQTPCPCCGGGHASTVTTLPFKITTGQIETPIKSCSECGCYWRSLPESYRPELHFEIASYTSEDREERWRSDRDSFFKQILALVEAAVGERRRHFETSRCWLFLWPHDGDLQK